MLGSLWWDVMKAVLCELYGYIRTENEFNTVLDRKTDAISMRKTGMIQEQIIVAGSRQRRRCGPPEGVIHGLHNKGW